MLNEKKDAYVYYNIRSFIFLIPLYSFCEGICLFYV